MNWYFDTKKEAENHQTWLFFIFLFLLTKNNLNFKKYFDHSNVIYASSSMKLHNAIFSSFFLYSFSFSGVPRKGGSTPWLRFLVYSGASLP